MSNVVSCVYVRLRVAVEGEPCGQSSSGGLCEFQCLFWFPGPEHDLLVVLQMNGKAFDVMRFILHDELKETPASLWRTDVPGIKVLVDLIHMHAHCGSVMPFMNVLV